MNKLTRLSALAAFAVGLGLAGPAQAALVSITGGTAVGTVPPGNSVLVPAGITFAAGGSIIQNGTLRIGEDDVTLTLYFVGSESGWTDQIRLGNTAGPALYHTENFGVGGGVYNPETEIGSVTQDSGRANLRFYWTNPTPDKRIVTNGYSAPLISGQGRASLAFAYLNELDQIVKDPTNRILVLLDDAFGHSPDRDYDDGVWIVVASTPVPLPAAAWLLGSGLLGLLGFARRRKVA